jgi:hypothetical protein
LRLAWAKMQDFVSENTKSKITGAGVYKVEHLPSKHEAPSSRPSTANKIKCTI